MAIEVMHTYKTLPYKIDGKSILVDTSYQKTIDSFYKQGIGDNKKSIEGNVFDASTKGQNPSQFRTWYLNDNDTLNKVNFAAAGMTTKGGSQPDYKITDPGTYHLSYDGNSLVITTDISVVLYRCYYSISIKSIKIWVYLVGGGGGGGWGNAYKDVTGLNDGGGGGGGGGGGVVIHPLIIKAGETYKIIVGSGGDGAPNKETEAQNGKATYLYSGDGTIISYGNGGFPGSTTFSSHGATGGRGGSYYYKYSSTYKYIGSSGSAGGGGGDTTDMAGQTGAEVELLGSDFKIDYDAVGRIYKVGGEGTPAIYDGLRSYIGGGGGGVAGFYGSVGSSDTVDSNKVVTRTAAVYGGGGHGAGGNSDVSRVGSKGGDGLFAIWCL